jgi:hypothetical protein
MRKGRLFTAGRPLDLVGSLNLGGAADRRPAAIDRVTDFDLRS